MQSVAIIGGGSAGWMTAAYLNGALNQQGKRPTIKITLLESPDIPRISVGEATIPSMRHLLAVAGIQEDDFMRAADATYKQSIKYQNWVHEDGTFYHHPFTSFRDQPLDFSGLNWLTSDRSLPFINTCSVQPTMCEKNLAPRSPVKSMPFQLNYAFHMNAQKFADLLRDVSVSRGVRHVKANLANIALSERQWIDHVTTDTEEKITADLFVDCTGFRGKLIAETLAVDFESYAQYLLCDRAVTLHLPYDRFFPGTIRPYTTATALSNGWVWDIPMQNQRSIGYVHASSFIDKVEAEAELRRYQGPGTEDLSVRFVDFKVGRRKELWKGNCIAIGLAGGFIEPLESTGLYLSDLGAVLLAEHWPHSPQMMQAMANRYNRLMANRYYEILDFINMHYCLTRRTDSDFWREVQKEERINPRLRAKLNLWRQKPPSPHDFEDQWFEGMEAVGETLICSPFGSRVPSDTGGLWNHESYECILYGMHYLPEGPLPPRGSPVVASRPSRQVAFALQRLHHFPSHVEWLQNHLGMQAYHAADLPAGWR